MQNQMESWLCDAIRLHQNNNNPSIHIDITTKLKKQRRQRLPNIRKMCMQQQSVNLRRLLHTGIPSVSHKLNEGSHTAATDAHQSPSEQNA